MKLIFLILSSFTLLASDCDYFMSKDSVLYEGYTLNYSTVATELMSDKGYSRVFNDQITSNRVVIEIEEIKKKRFQFAVARFIFQGNSTVLLRAQKRCLYIRCPVSDFARVISKVFKQARKKMSDCH